MRLIILGSACEIVDKCLEGTCKNGGTCLEDNTCKCVHTFFGPTCEQNKTCSDSMCDHASNCEDIVSISYCEMLLFVV